MAEKFKDVTINGMKFRLGVPSSRDGVWIITAMQAGKYTEPQTYARIQDIVLNKVQYIRPVNGEEIPQPLYFNGKWLVPDLNLDSDVDTAFKLTEEAIEFVTGPTLLYLIEKAEKAQAESAAKAQSTSQ